MRRWRCDTLAATEDTPVTYRRPILLGNDTRCGHGANRALAIAAVTQRHGRHGGVEQRRWHGDLHAERRTSTARRAFSYTTTDGAVLEHGDGDGERGAGERCAGGGGGHLGGDRGRHAGDVPAADLLANDTRCGFGAERGERSRR